MFLHKAGMQPHSIRKRLVGIRANDFFRTCPSAYFIKKDAFTFRQAREHLA
jgi:hypothetical protein